MIIKKLSPSDNHIPTLAQWFQHQWGYLYPERTVQCVEKKLQAHLLGAPIPTTFLALKNDTPLGTAALIDNDMETRPHYWPWLASVYVEQHARNCGLGAQLVTQVCEHAKLQGIKSIYLFTPDKADWYKKLGWQTIEEVNYHQENVTVMIKNL